MAFINVAFNKCHLANTVFHSYRGSEVDIIFKECDLESAKLHFPCFQKVKFDKVNLKYADFKGSDLRGVDFNGLDVRGANFTCCIFGNNNLDKANTEGTKFSSIDHPQYSPRGLDFAKLKDVLFSNENYYEPGYE